MSTSPGGIAFAPNVTPGTFHDPYPPSIHDDDVGDSLLFPPQSDESAKPRKTHARKKPENYIPRPPNAFILFRSSFIRSQHVSTGVETNHSTLSKIIGLTWQNLPHEERQLWHRKAKLAEEQHRIKFPQYAFKPLHKKNGAKRKVREVGPKDHTRCAKIAELLVQGKKGKELDNAVREFDKTHVRQVVARFEVPVTEQSFRRSGSAPAGDSEESETNLNRRASRRASSSKPSRRSVSTNVCPSPLSTEILSLPPVPLTSQTYDAGQDASYLSVPSFDRYSFDSGIKIEQPFDFNSFTFNPVVPSSNSLYQFESHTQIVHPLDSTFVPPSSSQPNIMLPRLSTESSLLEGSESWARCDSPGSPSTNTNSMPTTPAYPGTPPPNEHYIPYASHSTPDYTFSQKSSYDVMAHYNPYQDSTPVYDGPVPFVESHCDYTQTQLQPRRSDMQQMDLDYSTFMASIPSYSV
ncbi:hypothetical protein FA15DRAFT_655093 [Coprinopsis marcescibilis]|uniref:HMG box domain-containing protein n=1 Tax=Coprinopsis marcescibilis TaxID=230819 RepID=A0A5C3LAU5_COPMA|nr:hypothetical protein FA15DRAFT_655093 [Coprinopsis marcescibilis]